MPICDGKIGHVSKKTAKVHLKHLQSLPRWQRNESPKGLNIYRCPLCLNWHVGHLRLTTSEEAMQ